MIPCPPQTHITLSGRHIMILAGATAIVTGGAVRIGRSIAQSLAEAGVNVCVHYGRSRAEAEAAVREFQSCGVKACCVQADLSRPTEAADKIVEYATNTLGPVGILINSAAIFESGTALTTDATNWRRHLTINLEAPFFLSQAFVRHLPEGISGSIINIVDWRGEAPIPGHFAYTISKAGLIAQSRLLAQELGPQVRVNAIAPGAILPAPGDSQQNFEAKGKLNLLQRTGSPENIARGVLFLLQSDFVTGEVLHITGGEQYGRLQRSSEDAHSRRSESVESDVKPVREN